MKTGEGTGVCEGSGEGDTSVDGAAADGEGEALLPHAPNTSAKTTTRVIHRVDRFMSSSLLGLTDPSEDACGWPQLRPDAASVNCSW